MVCNMPGIDMIGQLIGPCKGFVTFEDRTLERLDTSMELEVSFQVSGSCEGLITRSKRTRVMFWNTRDLSIDGWGRVCW